MRNIAVCGSRVKEFVGAGSHFEQFDLDGAHIICGLIHTKPPDSDLDRFHVLVNIKAFSCNYRDKALVFSALQKNLEKSYYVVGSEFVGEVVAVGPGVSDLAVGDRVIGNNHYAGLMSEANGIIEGIPTNHASKEYQVFHQSKLIPIPAQMPDTIAAAFSLNSQTAYSMLRKLDLKPGAKILVMAAKSNVSLFVLNALRKRDVNVFATTTSLSFETRLKELGVAEVLKINQAPNGSIHLPSLQESASRVGPFDAVIDPFFDIHFTIALGLLAAGGKYITCGFAKQGPNADERPPLGLTMENSLGYAMIRNLQFIGNCLGSTEDLSDAIRDFTQGSYNVIIDSVYHGNQIAGFFNRTYGVRERFGKVVYVYD